MALVLGLHECLCSCLAFNPLKSPLSNIVSNLGYMSSNDILKMKTGFGELINVFSSLPFEDSSEMVTDR